MWYSTQLRRVYAFGISETLTAKSCVSWCNSVAPGGADAFLNVNSTHLILWMCVWIHTIYHTICKLQYVYCQYVYYNMYTIWQYVYYNMYIICIRQYVILDAITSSLRLRNFSNIDRETYYFIEPTNRSHPFKCGLDTFYLANVCLNVHNIHNCIESASSKFLKHWSQNLAYCEAVFCMKVDHRLKMLELET